MNVANLSRGLVRCSIVSDVPLPPVAYGILAELASAVETADARLRELLEAEEST